MRFLLRSLAGLGPLRAGLGFVALVVIADAPFARTEVETDLLGFLRSVLAPTLLVMLLFTLALDVTMTRVFMIDGDAALRRRGWNIIRFECALAVLLLAAWYPWLRTVLAP